MTITREDVELMLEAYVRESALETYPSTNALHVIRELQLSDEPKVISRLRQVSAAGKQTRSGGSSHPVTDDWSRAARRINAVMPHLRAVDPKVADVCIFKATGARNLVIAEHMHCSIAAVKQWYFAGLTSIAALLRAREDNCTGGCTG